MTGATEGDRGGDSLREACRLIERHVALVERRPVAVEVALAPPQVSPPSGPPPRSGMTRQVALIALRWSAVAAVTIGVVVVLALLVELR
jgi:hypothetical protein